MAKDIGFRFKTFKNKLVPTNEFWTGGKTTLEAHRERMKAKYEEWAEERRREDEGSTREHQDIKTLMKTAGIACKKYNYSLDEKPQPNYDALLRLSLDEKELIISHQTEVMDPAGPDFSNVPEMNDKTGYFEGLEIQKMKEDIIRDMETFVEERKSHASCQIKDIKGFVFGGFNSRFWMVRKNAILRKKKELDSLPFYNWECISLELSHRSIDIVIRNQTLMDKFIKFLIYTLKTKDGVAGSSEPLLQEKFQIECQRLKHLLGAKKLDRE